MLDDKTVKEYLAELGYASVKSFQLAVMYPKYVDGKYGQQTENALISAINVKRNTKNFSVKEFRCECGGRYCCGFPSTLKVEMLRNIQAIRDHYGRPITVTCGLRDKTYNSKLGGSIQNSLHLSGRAVDFYQQGVTDTLANRKRSIKWIRTLPNHHYTYGNGIATLTTNGKVSTYSVSAPYMGNALHTDVYVKVSPYDRSGKLICDGEGGSATIKEMQRFFGTPQDGIISGQRKALNKYYPALKAVEYGTGGSTCVRYLQKWLGVPQDGVLGKQTVTAWQKKIGATADGIFGTNSMKAWQKYLNANEKAVYPKQTIVDKELEACKAQSVWMKNATYKWESKPTVAKSKKKGTCVTYVACVLQRIGVLKSGQYIWHNGKGYGTGKVVGANDKMAVTYMGNKTLSSLKSQLKAGDIIMVDDNKSGESGSGGHIFILTGSWSGSNPYIWDNETARKGQKPRTYSGSRKVLARVRLK